MSQIFIKLEFQNWIDEIFFIEKKNDKVLSKGYEEVPQFESRIHRVEIINYYFLFQKIKKKNIRKIDIQNIVFVDLRNFLFIQNQYNVNKQHYRKVGEFY